MTKGIAAARYLQIISLRDSKLDTQSCLNILLTLPRGVEELDLSFNPEIGLEVYQKLGRILDGNDDKMLKNLHSLQFESNQMDNIMFEVLC